MRRFGTGVNALREAMSSADIELRLADGSSVRLAAPPIKRTVQLEFGKPSSIALRARPGALPRVVMQVKPPWRSGRPGAMARCESDAGTVGASWDAAAGSCVVVWTSDEAERLQVKERALEARKEELRKRPAEERQFIEDEIADLGRSVTELREAIRARQVSPPAVGLIEIRDQDGKVLGQVEVVLSPGKAQ